MDDTKRQALASKIEIAFKKAPYPGDNNIGMGPFDGDAVERAFKGKHWKELSLDLLFYHRDKLPVLTPDAFRFYLPAYLLGVLNHFDKLDTLVENLPFNLAVSAEGRPAKRLVENAKVMSAEEKAMILEFLQNYKDIFSEGFYSDALSEDIETGIRFWATQV